MADKKEGTAKEIEDQIRADEEKVKKFVEKANTELLKEMDGKPYLFVLTTLHEIGREGGKSKLAAQWNWRSNLDSREEGRGKKEVETSRTLMKFLAERLADAVDHPEFGIKKKYKLE